MKKVVFITAVFTLALALPASADTLTLLSSADIGYASDTLNTATVGKYGYMNADLGGSGTRRMLIQWDLSSIPAGSTVTSAQMIVYRYVSTDNPDGDAFSTYRMTSQWTEGNGWSNGGSPPDIGPKGANWTYRMLEGADGIGEGQPTDTDDPIAWTTPGGDRDESSRIQFTGVAIDDASGRIIGFNPDITSIAQSWVSGDNFGLMVVSDETVYQRHAMLSRDFGYPDDGMDRPAPGAYAPKLLITYTAGGPTYHPGDINGDGTVDLQDFGVLKDNFGTTEGAVWATGDITGDGAVDLQDFGVLKDHFGHTNGDSPVTAVPEPATMSLLALAGLGLIRRNRK